MTSTAPLVARIRAATKGPAHPILVALDGPSGSGKSTLAEALARELEATVVPCDDFFAASLTDADWDARSPAERARDALDWRRLRAEALEPLRHGREAMWWPFDFAAGTRPDGSYEMGTVRVVKSPRPVILVEGAYSSRPELADLLDLTILVDAPAGTRRARLALRDKPAFREQWSARWGAAEEHYFTVVRPPGSFDVVYPT